MRSNLELKSSGKPQTLFKEFQICGSNVRIFSTTQIIDLLCRCLKAKRKTGELTHPKKRTKHKPHKTLRIVKCVENALGNMVKGYTKLKWIKRWKKRLGVNEIWEGCGKWGGGRSFLGLINTVHHIPVFTSTGYFRKGLLPRSLSQFSNSFLGWSFVNATSPLPTAYIVNYCTQPAFTSFKHECKLVYCSWTTRTLKEPR